MKKFNPAISLLAIVGITFIVFLPCLKNGFLNWDDDVYITDNPVVLSLSLWSIKKVFTSFLNNAYQPLTLLGFVFQYHVFKFNPFGYHAVNLLIHILNCLLVFWFIYLIAKDYLIAFITTIFFAIHPLRVESVAWLSELKGLLAALFFLGTLISYLYYLRTRMFLRYYYLAIVFCTLSLMSKALAVTICPVLLLLDYVTDRPYNRKMLVDKMPFFCISLAFGIIAVIANSTDSLMSPFGVIDKILIVCYAVVFYIQKHFIPFGLSALYPLPPNAALLGYFILTVSVVLLLLCLPVFRKRPRRYLFGILFFLLVIFPALQFIRVGQSVVADRYTYLASLGICYFCGQGCAKAFRIRHRWVKGILLLVFAVVIFNLGELTYRRAKIWREPIVFWSNILAQYPSALAYNNRGNVYMEQGNFEQALMDFNRSLEIDPDYSPAYFNRGVFWERRGYYEKAISDFNKAHALKPTSAVTLTNRGLTYENLGNPKEALADYTAAIHLDPDYPLAYLNRGDLWYRQQDYGRAFIDYSKAIEINPHYLLAYLKRGPLYYRQGDLVHAIFDYNKALKLDPQNDDAYYNRGLANKKKGDWDRALNDFTHAIQYGAAKPDAFYERGNVFYELRDYTKAIEDYTRAIEINPGYRSVYINRAFAYFYKGDYAKSWLDVRQAGELKQGIPDDFIRELKRLSGADFR